MNYPAILIFSDLNVKIINSEEDVNGDIDWSCINYDEDDLVVDSNLKIGRFAGNESEDKMFGTLSESNIIFDNRSKQSLDDIKIKLEKSLKKKNIQDEEANFIKDLINRIESNA